MNVSEMLSKIMDGINDDTLLQADLLARINDKRKEIASRVRLPGLLQEDGRVIFNAGAFYTVMPSDYEPEHGVLYAYSLTNSLELYIRSNTKVLYQGRDRISTGTISEVAVEGTLIHCYLGTASKDKVRIKYYTIPDDLEYDDTHDDSPGELPSNLHEGLLVDGIVFDRLKYKRYQSGQDMEMKRDSEIRREAAAAHSAAYAELMNKYKESPQLGTQKLRRKVVTF